METQDTITATLAERGARYGDFTDHARIAQRLQDDMRAEHGWERCDAVQKQALSVIADKIARILSGDPNYDDNWRDIQGYARLVEERLPGSKVAKTTAAFKDADGFHPWMGGERPVAAHTVVRVQLRNGKYNQNRAGEFYWGHESSAKEYHITRYKIVE